MIPSTRLVDTRHLCGLSGAFLARFVIFLFVLHRLAIKVKGMKYFFLSLLVLCGFQQKLSADIMFTLSPASLQVPQGDIAVFNIFLSSDTPGGQLVDGVDVNANAGPGDGTRGVFSASSTFLFGSAPFEVIDTPGQAFSTNSGSSQTITTPILYGTLNLNTAGVPLGIYPLTLDQLNANNPTAGAPAYISRSIDATFQVIAPVPEPSSFLMLTGLSLGCVLNRRRRAGLIVCAW